MRIGIDARPLSVERGGIPRFLQNILSELSQVDHRNQYYLYSHRDFKLPDAGEHWHKRVGSQFSFLPGTLWLQIEGKRMMLEDRLDVFWGCAHALPLGLPRSVRKYVTVHDLTWRFHPETMKFHNKVFHFLFVERSIREADVIFADSQSTADSLERTLRIERLKIHTVYLGASSQYKPRDSASAAHYIASKFQVSSKYICTVGTVEPRKNVVTVIEAIAHLRRQGLLADYQLLIAGAKGWKDPKIYSSVRRCGLASEDVCFLGYVADEDLPLLYSGSTALVFPSLYEGFGLPLVEAMACGVPIVASNVSSIPEIVQEAGILVPPLDAEGFAKAILRIVRDVDLRRELVEKGLRRAHDFRWDAAAREVLRLFSESCRRTTGDADGASVTIAGTQVG